MTHEFKTPIECDLYDDKRRDLRCENMILKWSIQVNTKTDGLEFDFFFKGVSGLFEWVTPRLDEYDWDEDQEAGNYEVSFDGWTIDNKLELSGHEATAFFATINFDNKTVTIE